jgi:predicted dehydrogenase
MRPSLRVSARPKAARRYAVCGISNRAIQTFVKPITGEFRCHAKLVAMLDVDPKRFAVCKREAPAAEGVPCYPASRLGAMLRETRPDALIVAGRDDTHCRYILAGLERGLRVITEKPMVANARDAARVLRAEKGSRGKVIVAFNYRYAPIHRRIREMVQEGRLGRIASVDLNWYIDTYHGASYFKRWNRDRRLSGGLAVHKCCHHFDLVSWWIAQQPVQVFACGALNHYGPRGEHNPAPGAGRHCGTCGVKARCAYVMRWTTRSRDQAPKDDHLADPGQGRAASDYTGYRPDACIFDPAIEVEDTYAATIRYDGGALLSYSANFSAPYEGYRLAINGTRGRLETMEYHAPHRVPFPVPQQTLVWHPLFGSREVISVVRSEGGHGGGDPLLLEDLFLGEDPRRSAPILAGARAGAMAVATGEAVWRSHRANRPVDPRALLGLAKETRNR